MANSFTTGPDREPISSQTGFSLQSVNESEYSTQFSRALERTAKTDEKTSNTLDANQRLHIIVDSDDDDGGRS